MGNGFAENSVNKINEKVFSENYNKIDWNNSTWYKTNCCGLQFVGKNHSPFIEVDEVLLCRNCDRHYEISMEYGPTKSFAYSLMREKYSDLNKNLK
jgi:transposase